MFFLLQGVIKVLSVGLITIDSIIAELLTGVFTIDTKIFSHEGYRSINDKEPIDLSSSSLFGIVFVLCMLSRVSISEISVYSLFTLVFL